MLNFTAKRPQIRGNGRGYVGLYDSQLLSSGDFTYIAARSYDTLVAPQLYIFKHSQNEAPEIRTLQATYTVNPPIDPRWLFPPAVLHRTASRPKYFESTPIDYIQMRPNERVLDSVHLAKTTSGFCWVEAASKDWEYKTALTYWLEAGSDPANPVFLFRQFTKDVYHRDIISGFDVLNDPPAFMKFSVSPTHIFSVVNATASYTLTTINDDGMCRLWSVPRPSPNMSVFDVAMSGDGKLIAVVSTTQWSESTAHEVALYEASSGYLLSTFVIHHGTRLIFSDDGLTLRVLSFDTEAQGHITIIDME